MSVTVVPHLNFRGDACHALSLYQSVFGGNLALITYKDAGNVQDPSDAELVMWGQVTADNGFRVMAYDVPAGRTWDQGEGAFFVSLRGETAEEIAGYWRNSPLAQPLFSHLRLPNGHHSMVC